MPALDDPANGLPADPLERLHHELKTPLTVVSGRAQLIARAIRRSPSLSDTERAAILESLVVIEGAVLTLVAYIDTLGADDLDREDR